MTPKQHRLLFIALGLCALVAGHSLYQIYSLKPASQTPPQAQKLVNDYNLIGQASPSFRLRNLKGQLEDASQWQNRTRIINFWATWCAPCRKEIPDLIAVQSQYENQGVQVIGVAIDRPEMVYEFAQEYKINYPVLYGEQDAMTLNEAFGNKIGALPYTILVDKDGIIRAIHDRGVLDKAQIETMLEKVLSNAQKAY